jgi:heterodisulfide reductase subunit B2
VNARKKYMFYPGCSQESSALEYKTSTLAVLEALGAEVEEIEGWTCCGASAASVMSELLGVVLPARNLALAEQSAPSADGAEGEGLDVLTVCSACYTNFRRTSEAIASDPSLLKTINQALEVEGLVYRGAATARHVMDVLANDFDLEAIKERVQRPLTGLTVAPYYGCQTVRPYSPFDDDQRPTSMVAILEALGVTVHRHNREASCCGTSLLTTKPDVGVRMAASVLEACEPADCAVTVCPMCHMNLDSYQGKASQAVGQPLSIPVLFLPQLIGLAFGLPESTLMLHRHVVPVRPVLERLKEAA